MYHDFRAALLRLMGGRFMVEFYIFSSILATR